MDASKLTTKAQEALSAAIRQASSAGNPDVTPVHLLLALLEQPDGIAYLIVDSSIFAYPRFAEMMKKRREDRTRLFQKLALDHVELRSGEDYSRALQKFFQARARRMAA